MVIYEPNNERTPILQIQQLEDETKTAKVTQSSLLAASFLLWTDVIGIGPLASGYYMGIGGVWFTVMATVFVALISDYTLNLIFYLAHKYHQPDYVDMCKYALGNKGKILACFFMFVYNFGGLCANLLVVGSAVPALLQKATGHDYELFHREFVLLFATLILLPVAFLKDIASFAIACVFTVAFFLGGVGVFLYLGIEPNITNNFEGFRTELTVWEPHFLQVMGGLCYVFVCHDMSFSVAVSLKNPTPARWAGVVHLCMIANVTLSLLVGFFTYTVFYSETEAFIPDNYGPTDTIASIARFFIVAMIVSSVPYSCYLPRLALLQLVDSFFPKDVMSPKQLKFLHIGLSLAVPLGALCIAELVTSLGIVLSFLGGFSAAGLGFIMPPLVLLNLGDARWYHKEKLPYAAVFVFGVFCISVTIATTLMAVIQPS